MDHLRCDICTIGCNLAPAHIPGVGRNLNKTNEFVGERFDVCNFHV